MLTDIRISEHPENLIRGFSWYSRTSWGNIKVLEYNGLAERIRALGHSAKVRRVFHGLNVFGDNPLLNCEHVCGENYSQHFVVECDGNILDPKLSFPVLL